MAFKIALIRCGNLGSRHLQGLKKVREKIQITICEPVESARKTAVERYSQIENNENIVDFQVLDDYHRLEPDYDLAIVATNAANRYEIASWLVENLKIRYLILEKVVFQTLEEFEWFGEKLKNRNIKTWVNCARRMYPFYQDLRTQLEDEEWIDMYVSGGNWGMGSNTLHMVDLYYFLTRFKQYEFDNSGLEDKVSDSKRSGYKEFFGSLIFKTDRGKLSIRCGHEDEPFRIKLVTNKGERDINEADGIVCYQSNLTNVAVEKIIEQGECDLTTYEESFFLHEAVLTSFLSHINKFSEEEVKRCPIT